MNQDSDSRTSLRALALTEHSGWYGVGVPSGHWPGLRFSISSIF